MNQKQTHSSVKQTVVVAGLTMAPIMFIAAIRQHLARTITSLPQPLWRTLIVLAQSVEPEPITKVDVVVQLQNRLQVLVNEHASAQGSDSAVMIRSNDEEFIVEHNYKRSMTGAGPCKAFAVGDL